MNIELRGQVLEKALTLENAVNKLVLLYLGINKEHRRAIGHKSGTLTYKNLLDLLYDIDVLDQQEWEILLLLMEIRNQFMHNIACDSFEKAIELLGSDKKKRLLKFNNSDSELPEDKYSSSFLRLATVAITILVTKVENKKKDIEAKSNYILELLKLANDYDSFVHDKLDDIIKKYAFTSEPKNEVDAQDAQIKSLLQIDLLELRLELGTKFGVMAGDLYEKSDYMAKRLLDGRQYNAT